MLLACLPTALIPLVGYGVK